MSVEFESLKTLEGYEPRDENRLFAYLALRNLLDTVEDYKFTSRGLDVFDAGIELHISGQLATRLSTIRPPILVPVQSPNAASPKWRRLEAKYAILEAGGGFVFGDEPISHRIDIALATDEFGGSGRSNRARFWHRGEAPPYGHQEGCRKTSKNLVVAQRKKLAVARRRGSELCRKGRFEEGRNRRVASASTGRLLAGTQRFGTSGLLDRTRRRLDPPSRGEMGRAGPHQQEQKDKICELRIRLFDRLTKSAGPKGVRTPLPRVFQNASQARSNALPARPYSRLVCRARMVSAVSPRRSRSSSTMISNRMNSAPS